LGACQNSSREKKDIPKEPIALAHLDTLNPGFNEFKVFRTGVFLQEVGGRKTISAVSLLCTHQTCAISFEGARFRCPCHGSIFSKEGQRLAGPARKPLRWFKLSISEGGEVFLHPWERVDSGWKLEIS
jgi:Rieske Fe-S protein